MVLRLKQVTLIASLLIFPCFSVLAGLSNNKICRPGTLDTTFAGVILPNTSLIKSTHTRYILMFYAHHTYSNIKFLDRDITRKGDQLIVLQKLYNGSYINTDSVIVNGKSLIPIESYSDINSSKESFTYAGNKVSGTMLEKEGAKKGALTKVDTTFPKPLFNGLIYDETLQSLSYQKNRPFYLAEYVPGHNTKFTRVEYIKDDDLTISGLTIPAKVLEERIGNIILHCWLNAKNQELLKIEGKLPGFDYYMVRML